MTSKKTWCDECKITVYDCDHLKGRDAAAEVPEDMPRDRKKIGLVFLSFNENFPGSSTLTIAANPQVPVKPRRLVVDPNVAAYFKILDIKIGYCSQFAAATGGGVSASIFPPTPEKYQPIANLDGLPIIPVGRHLMLTLHNQGCAMMNFNALVWCDFLEEETAFLSPHEILNKISGKKSR